MAGGPAVRQRAHHPDCPAGRAAAPGDDCDGQKYQRHRTEHAEQEDCPERGEQPERTAQQVAVNRGRRERGTAGRTCHLLMLRMAGPSGSSERGGSELMQRVGRVHAESAQQRCRGIWRLEREDLGQHLLGRDLQLPTIRLGRSLKHFLGRRGDAQAIFLHEVPDRRLPGHGAHWQWRSVGAGPQAQGAQGLVIERLKGLASLLQVHAQHGFDRGILKQGEQEVIGAGSAITSATSLLTGPQIDGPRVKHLGRIRWS